MKRLRILMVAPEPVFEPRGTPFSVVGRLKALSDMGYEVDLVTYGIGENIHLPGLRILRIPNVPGINKIKIGPSFQKIPLDFLLMLSTLLRLNLKRYNLIHTHEEAGFWGTLFSRWIHLPHIYDMHSSLPQQLRNFEFTQSDLIRRIFISLESWILKYASAVITICPDLENHVASLFPERGSVLIENVIDYDTLFGRKDLSPEIRKSLDLTGKRVVLYTGTLEPYQGVDLLIQSAGHVIQVFSDSVFLIVGGHPDQVEHYRAAVNSSGLSRYVLFTGQVRPEQISSYIRCADVLVSPRISGTNTPLKIYSYLRSGVPVVATRILTHTQVLNDRIAVLTDPEAGAFAEGIIRVFKDGRVRLKITREAVGTAGSSYSYGAYLEKFRKVIALAIERGS